MSSSSGGRGSLLSPAHGIRHFTSSSPPCSERGAFLPPQVGPHHLRSLPFRLPLLRSEVFTYFYFQSRERVWKLGPVVSRTYTLS